jgi:hypothetical protein
MPVTDVRSAEYCDREKGLLLWFNKRNLVVVDVDGNKKAVVIVRRPVTYRFSADLREKY